MKCLVDMDGVLTDFMRHAFNWHGKNYNGWPDKGNYDISKYLGKDYWTFTKDFWISMPKTKECDAIILYLEHIFHPDNIAILTSPGYCPEAAYGKVQWIHNNLPQYKDKLILTMAKEFCAHSEAILIDDSSSNIEKFHSAGGIGFLFPRPWNTFHDKDSMQVLRVQMEGLL